MPPEGLFRTAHPLPGFGQCGSIDLSICNWHAISKCRSISSSDRRRSESPCLMFDSALAKSETPRCYKLAATAGLTPDRTDSSPRVVASSVNPSASATGRSIFILSSSACLVITMMLMRRLMGFFGSTLSNSAVDPMPTTRAILSSLSPAWARARRAALARSAESSQLV